MTTRSSNERILFFSIADVAEWLGVSARTVRRWIKSGVLVTHRIGSVVRIAEHDLRQFLDVHRDD